MAKRPMYIYKVTYTINPYVVLDILGIPDIPSISLPGRYAEAEIAAPSLKEASEFANIHLIRNKGKKAGKIIDIQRVRQVNYSRYY